MSRCLAGRVGGRHVCKINLLMRHIVIIVYVVFFEKTHDKFSLLQFSPKTFVVSITNIHIVVSTHRVVYFLAVALLTV